LDTAAIVREIVAHYTLPVKGVHGVVHWARVLENGRRLVAATGVKIEIITLFSLFHDSRRENEHDDPGHGLRGANYARSMRGRLIDLSDPDFELLFQACRLHTDGLTDGDLILQACWDADRLDLGRVGISPDPEQLCTNAARDLIPWADGRATREFEPDIVAGIWGL
jgi:uncharacterized protein